VAGAPRDPVASRFALCARAFEEQFDYLYALLRRMGVPEADVEDAVQDVFTILWRRFDDYQPERPLRPWLAGIAIRRAYRYLDRNRREVPTSFVDPPGGRTAAVDDRVAAQALLEQALARVPETNREALILHTLDGLSMAAVAEALAIPLATAYTRVGRARRAFVAAARKLQGEGAARTRAVLPPVALLRLGREQAPAPPAGAKARALARARAQDPGPLEGEATLDGISGAPAPPHPFTFGMAAAAGAAVALLALLLWRAQAPAPASAAAGVTAGVTADAPAGARARAAAIAPRRPALAPPALIEAGARAGGGQTGVAGAHALARGIAGYWRFDEAAGSRSARDLSGHGNDCELRGVDAATAWSEGTLGGALDIRNLGRISCPQAPLPVRAAAEVTVALWMNRAPSSRYHQTLVGRQVEGTNQRLYMFAIYGNALVLDSQAWRLRLEHPLPPSEQWVHVAFTRARDGLARLYVGGVEVRSAAGGGYRASVPAVAADAVLRDHLTLGFSWRPQPAPTWSQQAFRGRVDELAVYDRALPPAEIAALAGGVQPRP
jgi:RNA polymerase sigma factor (sigma-70 family)